MKILNNLTIKYLSLNKKRTIVTIIGIILSASMICAVATLAVSAQQFMIDIERLVDGNWEAELTSVDVTQIEKIKNNKEIKDVMLKKDLGLAKLDSIDNKEKPFISVKQYDEVAMQKLGIKLISGRLPKNDTEIVLSVNNIPMDTLIEISLGKRMLEGEKVPEFYGKMPEEEFIVEETKQYTVVGIIERPFFERDFSYYISGITYINENDTTIDVLLNTKNPKNIYEKCEKIAEEINLSSDSISYHNGLLMYHGVSSNENAAAVLYIIAAIIILVIMLGSVLVIYNAFAISVSERKKQFGMLASIGATKKQLRKSVFFEGAILSLIAIPIGIISGIVGIRITLEVVEKLLNQIIEIEVFAELNLVISIPGILISVILTTLTIFISAYLPARRASKISPIEAIRLNEDIKIKNKKLKIPKIIRKIFGVEGEIALKNLKRSKKKYRATILSLTVSIVLFISVSGFVNYIFKGTNIYYNTSDYDFLIYLNDVDNELVDKIKSVNNIKECIMENNLEEATTYVFIKATDIDSVDRELAKLQDEYSFYYENVQKTEKQMKNLRTIIEIFSYGFIALITLIGVSNIFNTISTNIILRKKEFAMLKAIGMTNGGFNKMMNLECIFYGIKALVYSLPISILICYLIYRTMQDVLVFGFVLPWNSIIISIIGVFVIVFITMIYASRKIKKENIIDVLREENI